MVHEKKCKYGKRGNPTTEFYKNGKAQIYCRGWIDSETEEPVKECLECKDFVFGEQILKDLEEIPWKDLHCGNMIDWEELEMLCENLVKIGKAAMPDFGAIRRKEKRWRDTVT